MIGATPVTRILAATAGVLSVGALTWLGCGGFQSVEVASCAVEDPAATVNAAGVYRYAGEGTNVSGYSFLLSGTVTLEQDGNLIRVADCTYDSPGLRPIESEWTPLEGNKAAMKLVPRNGDTDYVADVTFIFNDGGGEFCVAYMDTNGDMGDMGSFRAVHE
jgi:hypothetical protein